MNKKGISVDAVILLCSLCAFSALHILQCGSKLLLAIYALLFIAVYVTKRDKRILFSQWRVGEIVVAVLSLMIALVYGYTSSSYSWVLQQYGFSGSSASVIVVGGCMGLMALPGLMFVLSWIREDSDNPLIDKVADFLSGKVFLWTCAGISALGIAALVYFSFSYSIWIDEAFSLALIDSGYDKIITVTSQDVHPPLYYIILKFCVDGMRSIFPDMPTIYASKLVSVLPFICLLAICMTWVRRQWGNCAAGLASIAVICLPPLYGHGVTIRMYSWSALWVICCYLQACRVAQKSTICRWIVFSLYGLLAAYTNYWACVAIGFIYLYTCVWSIRDGRKSFKGWCVAALLSVLGYVPWLYYFIGQFQHVANGSSPWFTEVSVSNYIYILMMYGYNLFIIFMVATCFLYFTRAHRAGCKEAGGELYCAAWGIFVPLFVMIIGAIMGLLYAPMMFSRHLLPGVACLWLSVCLSVHFTHNKKLKIVIPFMILPLAVTGNLSFVKKENRMIDDVSVFMHELHKKNTKAIISYYHERLMTASQLFSQASLYTYDNPKEMRPIEKQAFSKNIFHDINKPEQIRELLKTHETVYFVSSDIAESDKFARETRFRLKMVGRYEFDNFTWHVYEVE